MLLEGLDPAVGTHGSFDLVHSWLGAFVADLVQALFEGAFELVGCLSILVSVENSPRLHGGLSEHLGLDLAVELSCTLFNVKRVWSSAAGGTHDKITSFIFVASDLGRSVPELEVPGLLFFLTLLVLGEGGEEVLALLHLLVSVGVHDLGQILHEAEICAHCVCKTSELAELRNERNLVSSLPILVDQERLVGIGDVLIVAGLVVLLVADLSSIFVESC